MEQLGLTAVGLEAILKLMVDAAVRHRCKLFDPKYTSGPQLTIISRDTAIIESNSHSCH
jgi:hypothetical protein